MDKNTEELFALVEKATAGDREALETLIEGVQDLVFRSAEPDMREVCDQYITGFQELL